MSGCHPVWDRAISFLCPPYFLQLQVRGMDGGRRSVSQLVFVIKQKTLQCLVRREIDIDLVRLFVMLVPARQRTFGA